MGNNTSSTHNDKKDVGDTEEIMRNPQIRNKGADSDALTVIPNKKSKVNALTVSPASPLGVSTQQNNNFSATSAVPFNPRAQQSGGYVMSEIDIQIENIDAPTMYGGYNSDSSIQIETETFDNIDHVGQQQGGANEDFDKNKLLDIIMLMGGDNDSDSDSDLDTQSSNMSSELNTSSYQPKKFNKRDENDDSGSDSESSSGSDSSFDSDSDSDSDSESSNVVNHKKIASHIKNAITNSDVYIMSESDSAENRNISLLSFNDPLNMKKKGKNKKR